MSVTLLGTGGPNPDPERQGPALLVSTADKHYLFDAGRGVATRLIEAGVQPTDLDAIFITHHHFDHIGNLADLLLGIWNSGRTRALPVYGPKGTRDIVFALLTQVYSADIRFRLKVAEYIGEQLLDPNDLVRIIEIDHDWLLSQTACTFRCERVMHGHTMGMSFEELPCLGYRLSDGDSTIAISGDTVDCAGLEKLATDVDVLILCCYLTRDEEREGGNGFVSEHIMVSSADAGKIATKYRVKKLVLTHIRQKSADMINKMAREIADDYSGMIVVGKDLLEFHVPDY